MIQFIGEILCYVVLTAIIFTFSLSTSARNIREEDSI